MGRPWRGLEFFRVNPKGRKTGTKSFLYHQVVGDRSGGRTNSSSLPYNMRVLYVTACIISSLISCSSAGGERIHYSDWNLILLLEATGGYVVAEMKETIRPLLKLRGVRGKIEASERIIMGKNLLVGGRGSERTSLAQRSFKKILSARIRAPHPR